MDAGATVKRRAVVWQLLPGKTEAYEDEHRAIPAALAEEIRAQGIRNYSIYLHPSTGQLFAYFEIDESTVPSPPDGAEVKRWWEERMSRLLASNPDGTPVEHRLREVFRQE